MIVTIRERKAVYTPDYTPTNPDWKIQLQDAHRLLSIAGTECFIKRFERLLPAWSFLVANRGKRHVGLPLIYDAQSITENGRTVYYLFLEKIEGELLHDVIRTGGKASGPVLGRAMAAAFRVLSTAGYWHADFCTKNIMVTTVDKQFVLIDLDSLEPVTTPPNTTRNQPGYIPDQELAVYALTYVKTYVQPITKTFAAFPGPKLNQVQLIFLLDKLVYFAVSLKPQGAKFGLKKHFEKLPEIVHSHLALYTDRLVKDILAGRPIPDEVLLSQGSNFQAQLRAAPKPTLPSLTARVAPQPKPNSVVSKPAPAIKPPVIQPPAPPKVSLPPAIPSLITFSASDYYLKEGGVTILTWGVTGGGTIYISNIGTVPSIGTKALSASSFSGRTEFELTAGNSAVRKKLIIDFPIASTTKTASYATTKAPAANKIALPTPTRPPATPTTVKIGAWPITVVIAVIVSLIAVLLSSNFSKTTITEFAPNQQRGLELFDQGRYDSSFVHLVNFRNDTTYHFATQYNLAYMYDFGKGTAIDDTLAVELYRECLRSTTPKVVSDALYYLGVSYLFGEGCVRNVNEAKKCFAYAANNYNNQQARMQLQKFNQGDGPSVTRTTVSKLKQAVSKSLAPVQSQEQSITPEDVEVVAFEPLVNYVTQPAISIKRVVQIKDYTRVDFIYLASAENQSYIFLRPPGSSEAMFIAWAGLRYELKRTVGIGNADEQTYAYAGKPIYFSAFFERIPAGATKIDIIEGGANAWRFEGVPLTHNQQPKE